MSLTTAIEHARANPIDDLPRMAAIIMDGRRVVAKGWNGRRTHPLALRFSGTTDKICTHAELAAIVAAKEPVDGMAMYVARVYRNGQPALAKPCAACQRAILAFNLGSVEWTI